MMIHDWLYCRLPDQTWAGQGPPPSPRLPAGVREALALARSDPDARWFFQPLRDGSGPGTELWLTAGRPFTRTVQAALLTEAARTGSRLLHRPERRAPECTDELSARSSELALAVATAGGLPARDRFALAVRHLRHAAALVPDADRSAFLFLCWQHWAGRIDAGRRLLLGRQAAAPDADLLPDALDDNPLTGLDPALAGPWERYLDALDALAGHAATGGLPGNYLLFEQIHLTHLRLGVPPEAEALAALAIRNAPAAALPEPAVLQAA